MRIYIISEKVELRNKRQCFEELLARVTYSENDVANVIKQVLICLKFCHENKLTHINIRPENILLSVNEGFDNIKLTDLGTCQIYDPTRKGSQYMGTPTYIAPEVIQDRIFTCKKDTWACGMVAYVLIQGSSPFGDVSDNEIAKQLKDGLILFKDPVWSKISDSAKDFITQMLNP